MIIYFKNHKENDFDFSAKIKTEGWETYFHRLQGQVYTELVKDFWIHACVSPSNQIFSSVTGKKICVTEDMVAKLLNHDVFRNRCYEIPVYMENLDEMAEDIFQNGKYSSHAKNIHKNLRIWIKIFLGCIHHRPSINSPDYVNAD